MSRLEIVDSGIIYMNPDPANQHVFASHPHVLQISETELICIFSWGAAMCAPDMDIALARSADGGATWTVDGFLHDKSKDDRPFSYHGGFFSRMRSGTVVVFAFRADRSQPEKSYTSATGGLLANEPFYFFQTTAAAPGPIRFPSNCLPVWSPHLRTRS